ncbi:MAG: YihY/virulence factor BrkB family protein [Candidatus Schekmanbacteria bacterium]|nr:MAG: YihY/virulence factor BrkB family protein [Candidatus Schekmanbacteria bacterium]
MPNLINSVKKLLLDELDEEESELNEKEKFFFNKIKFLINAYREFNETQLTLRAMSLVYTTILSIVPLLAVSFSVLKAFGVHQKLEPFLFKFLTPLGPKGAEISGKIIGFVNNVKVGVLGSIGLILLFYTVISLIQKVEESFNTIWKVGKPRTIMRRISDYLSIILVAPVLVVSALGITASVMSASIIQKILSIEPLGTLLLFAGKIIPYFLVCLAFTFIYSFIPNTKVKFKSALLGGIVGGVLWETAGWAFTSFIASSGKYSAIYSSFAILILFMIWLYFNWLILLFGAFVSFCIQYPSAISNKKSSLLINNKKNEEMMLRIMYLIGKHFFENKKPWNAESLSLFFKLPIDYIDKLVKHLIRKGLLAESGNSIYPSLLPAKDIGKIKLYEIIDLSKTKHSPNKVIHNPSDKVDIILEKIDDAVKNSLNELSLKDLILEENKLND